MYKIEFHKDVDKDFKELGDSIVYAIILKIK